jgi:hypothetical protein
VTWARHGRALAGAALLLAACTPSTSEGAASTATDSRRPEASASDGGEGGVAHSSGGRGDDAPDEAERAGGGSETAGAGTTPDPPTDGGGHLPYTAPTAGPTTLPARVWKLSHAEYAWSAAALLGKDVDVSALEPELDNGVYPNMSASALVRVPLARSYYAVAKALSDGLADDELRALVPGGELSAASEADFIASAVARAFRRPPTDDELASYAEIFELGASEGDPALGFRSVLRALLTAPYFLYRTEVGDDASADEVSLTNYEIASLLSFSVTGGPPSDELLAAASRAELATTDGLAQALATLTRTPEATATLVAFASAWLELARFRPDATYESPALPEKDPALFPGLDQVRGAMLEETTTFLAANAGADATLRALLTAPVPNAKGALGAFYVSEPSGADGGTRTGVLALGTVLSLGASESASSPTQRGLFVRERLLCQELAPPGVVPPALAAAPAGTAPLTTRALYEQHAANPKCAGCHTLLDDAGFAFESFDAAGRFRTQENGGLIDTSAELWGSDVDGRYANPGELAAALAESEWVRECLATQAFRSYFGELEAERGIPPIKAARQALATGTFGDLVHALFGTETTYRRRRE